MCANRCKARHVCRHNKRNNIRQQTKQSKNTGFQVRFLFKVCFKRFNINTLCSWFYLSTGHIMGKCFLLQKNTLMLLWYHTMELNDYHIISKEYKTSGCHMVLWYCLFGRIPWYFCKYFGVYHVNTTVHEIQYLVLIKVPWYYQSDTIIATWSC